MAGNVVVDCDLADNIKPTKAKSPEKTDGIVAAIMAFDRCVRHENTASAYNDPDHGLPVFQKRKHTNNCVLSNKD